MYDTRFKGSFGAVPIRVYKPRSIRKRTLGSISCNTTTSRSLQPIPLNWVPLELLQDSDSSQAIAPHWSLSYPEYLSPEQDKAEQRRIVWARLRNHHSNLASRLSKQKERYLALCQELNPRTTQVESSHKLLFCDRQWQQEAIFRELERESLLKGISIELSREAKKFTQEVEVPKEYQRYANIFDPVESKNYLPNDHGIMQLPWNQMHQIP